MAKPFPAPTRRELLKGFGASAVGVVAAAAAPAAPARLAFEARAGTVSLRPQRPPTPVSELASVSDVGSLRLKRGERYELSFRNDLPVAVTPVWDGFEGTGAGPLKGWPPTAPGGTERTLVSMPYAGTWLADIRLFESGLKHPGRPLPVVIEEIEPVAVDRDEVFLIEDWRLTADGAALVPGSAAGDAEPLYTVNGQNLPDFTVRSNERLRLRVINGCQRAVIAIKIGGTELTVLALDGQPAEPFIPRNGAVVLAPGGRCDAVLDGTPPPRSASPILLHDGKAARTVARLLMAGDSPLRANRLPPASPLPGNGLPARLELKRARRADVALGPGNGWLTPAGLSAAAAPAFRAKLGRTVVLALSNRGPIANVFHLHGHHFRLLDRLDDGWKPYWLDTLAIEPGQTERIALAANQAGQFLLESVATDWSAPRLARWYVVD